MRQRILIAALGGEGGGVLAGWITDAAIAAGFVAQRTSIPGVAQRTGATTYYIELMPAADGRRAIMSLNPVPGEVDLFVASELMEAARIVQGGFITPQKTTLIASTHRVFTIQERMAMGDGRADPDQLRALVERFAKASLLIDFNATASRVGSHLNAVLLGAMSRFLPIPPDALVEAVRRDGRAVESNLRGFDAGRAAADQAPATTASPPVRPLREIPPDNLRDLVTALPANLGPVVSEALHRLIDFQDETYARLYGARLLRFLSVCPESS